MFSTLLSPISNCGMMVLLLFIISHNQFILSLNQVTSFWLSVSVIRRYMWLARLRVHLFQPHLFHMVQWLVNVKPLDWAPGRSYQAGLSMDTNQPRTILCQVFPLPIIPSFPRYGDGTSETCLLERCYHVYCSHTICIRPGKPCHVPHIIWTMFCSKASTCQPLR